MSQKENLHILAACIVFFAISSFGFLIQQNWGLVGVSALVSVLIVLGSVTAKKVMANALDSSVEHEIWAVTRYGWRPEHHFKAPFPIGIIFPIVVSLYSLGKLSIPTLLTYEVTPLKRRAAKRFGNYSYTEITERDISLIGAAGILFCLALGTILYFLPWNLEYFAALSVLYAFFNMFPIEKLDGAQIFFGSRVIWTSVAIVVTLFSVVAFALILN